MKFEENQLYHIYNQGNNKENIFYNKENYIYFLKKIKLKIVPITEIFAYCLMPNHFHFLVYTTKDSVILKKSGGNIVQLLNERFRILQSSYAQAINKEQKRTGSLFRQKSKAKLLNNKDTNYPFTCFNYIQQNPLVAGLVKKMEDWPFSSFREYIGLQEKELCICNQELAYEMLDLPKDNFYQSAYNVIINERLKK